MQMKRTFFAIAVKDKEDNIIGIANATDSKELYFTPVVDSEANKTLEVALFESEKSALKSYNARIVHKSYTILEDLANIISSEYAVTVKQIYNKYYRLENYREFKQMITFIPIEVTYTY